MIRALTKVCVALVLLSLTWTGCGLGAAASSATAAPAPPAAPARSPAAPAQTCAGAAACAPSAPPADAYLAAQAAALLPAQAGDLGQSSNWERYTISAALDPATLTVRGSVDVRLRNPSDAPLRTIAFHLYPNHPDFGGRLDVTSATVGGAPVPSTVANSDTLLQLQLPVALAPGATAEVRLGFTARTPRNNSAKSFGAFNAEAGVWAMANFYPVLARYFSGSGWDTRPIESRGDFTVTEVALYDVTIDVPRDWTLASTGVRISDSVVNEGIKRERFVSGPQREFFLAALRGLERASSVVAGTRIVSHYRAGDAAAGRRSLVVAEQALQAFNGRYGLYPLAEVELIEAALTQFLGMEYPGIVLIEQDLYASNGRGLETTIVHELAHQWWYSQVGNDAQGEPWLDEGLASYAQVLYYEAQGDARRTGSELQFFRDTYSSVRGSSRDAPLATPPSALRGNYVPIVYAKGALFFHALRAQIGEQAFSDFLRGYYAASRYREIAGPDLLAAAERACACQLDTLFRDWVLTATKVPLP